MVVAAGFSLPIKQHNDVSQLLNLKLQLVGRLDHFISKMNNPELELRQIILDLTENDDAAKHKATVDRYFTEDAEFIHPLCTLSSGPGSRESLKSIYAVYKFFTRDIEIDIQKITVDSNCSRAVIEMEESLSATFLPILRIKHLKIITILDFERVDNRFYIKRQYGTCRP